MLFVDHGVIFQILPGDEAGNDAGDPNTRKRYGQQERQPAIGGCGPGVVTKYEEPEKPGGCTCHQDGRNQRENGSRNKKQQSIEISFFHIVSGACAVCSSENNGFTRPILFGLPCFGNTDNFSFICCAKRFKLLRRNFMIHKDANA